MRCLQRLSEEVDKNKKEFTPPLRLPLRLPQDSARITRRVSRVCPDVKLHRPQRRHLPLEFQQHFFAAFYRRLERVPVFARN